MSQRNYSKPGRLELGAILFPGMDQADFTGPFAVLSRLPNSRFHILATTLAPVRDARGLVLKPDKRFSETPSLDLLLVPGGPGVNAVMQDAQTLAFIRCQAKGAKFVLSVCTGALACGAAGLLNGRKATTHWASHHLLRCFGALPVNARVVVDGKLVSTAGVTAGIDGALRVAALLRGKRVAQELQLYLQYAPEPPFNSGTPETAPPPVLKAGRDSLRSVLKERENIIQHITIRNAPRIAGR
jgi:cyclohexyl-isocyanide hydratase